MAHDAMEAGYLGVGNMGQPMAHKLLDAGHGLTIYDLNEAAMQPLLERQARRAASPRDLADRCEIVFVSLPTLAAFREVAFGADGLDKGAAMKLLVNTCTIGVPFVKEIEAAMAARGVTVSARWDFVCHGVRRSCGGRTGHADDLAMGAYAHRGRRQAGRGPSVKADEQYPFGGRVGGYG
jgi:NAD binding domain of 6-phosphogluconate dehydrogenase